MVQSLALADVRDVLLEFLGSIGEEGSAADAERERNRVRRMLTALGFEGPLEKIADPAPAQPAAPAEAIEQLQSKSTMLCLCIAVMSLSKGL